MHEKRLHTTGRSAAIAAALLLGLLQPVLRAQPAAPETFAESIEVDLVSVDVHVFDSDGQPVPGLARDRFSVLHDGTPVEISHFVEIREGKAILPRSAGASQTPAATSQTPFQPPHLILVFDVQHLTADSQSRLTAQISDFLVDGPVPPERILLVRLEGALFIEAPFGSTREELAAALRELEKRERSTTGMAAVAKQTTDALQGVWNELNSSAGSASIRSVVNQVTGPTASQGLIATGSGGGGGSPGSAGAASGLACDDFVDRVEPILDSWSRSELAATRTTVSRLADASSFLSGIAGPKTLIYMSDGMGAAPGVAATDFVRGMCPAFKTDLELDSLPEQVDRLFEELEKRASSNRITVHALYGRGFEGSLGRVAGQASADTRGLRLFERSYRTNARTGLELLSEGTGGRVLQAGADLREALTSVERDLENFYSLAYSPPPNREVRYHRIDVEVNDSAVQTRHRTGYREKTSDEWLTERLEGALYLGLVENPLSVRLGAGEVTPVTEERSMIPLHVIVPSDRLAFRQDGDRPLAKVRIKVLTLNAATRTLTVTDRNLFLPRPIEGAGDLVDMRVDVETGNGNQLLAIAVRDETSGETSVVSTALEIGS